MASAADLKMAAVCMLLLLCAGPLMVPASAGRDAGGDAAAPLRLPELELEEELALLDDGAVGATVCPASCQKCLVGCGTSITCIASIVSPPSFVACFVACAIAKDCFAKK